MKAKIILSLSLLIPLALIFIYVWTTATDLVISDDMYLIKGEPFEHYLKGTFTFADLWRPGNLGRTMDYNILQNCQYQMVLHELQDYRSADSFPDAGFRHLNLSGVP